MEAFTIADGDRQTSDRFSRFSLLTSGIDPLHSGSEALQGDACSKGMETDEALREFLTGGAGRAGRADEAGPSVADLRELRSLSLSFSLVGAPIGVSLAESDLTDLRCFLQGKSIPSLQVRSTTAAPSNLANAPACAVLPARLRAETTARKGSACSWPIPGLSNMRCFLHGRSASPQSKAHVCRLCECSI